MNLSPRREQILGAIIQEYTETAEPVSSQVLHEKYEVDASPATIRAEMFELEKDGYLEQPHTSAGRAPSGKAYRYFVDNLMKERKSALTPKERQHIDRQVGQGSQNPHSLSQRIAQVIAEISENGAVGGILDTGEFYKSGLSGLFEMPEFHEYDRMMRVTSVFDDFEDYVNDIMRRFFGDELSVFIGNENPIRTMRDETIIMTRYPLPNGLEGAAAMIGPIRMRYGRNIALMKYITSVMNSHN